MVVPDVIGFIGGRSMMAIADSHGSLVYVSQMPPYDPATGDVRTFPVAEQAEIVIKQMDGGSKRQGRHWGKSSSAPCTATTQRICKPSTKSMRGSFR